MKEILVIAEYDRKDISDLTKEILGLGRSVARETGALLAAVILGEGYGHLGEVLASYGADRIYTAKHKAPGHDHNEIYIHILDPLIRQKQPALVLCGMTADGRDLASRLAARLKTVFIAGCTHIAVQAGGKTAVTRYTYGGFGQEMVTIQNPAPVILGITPESRGIEAPRVSPDFHTELIDAALPDQTKVTHVDTYRSDPGEIDLTEADVVLAGGNGLGSRETFHTLREAGTLMGAAVGGSRVALDKGWISHDRMIGATGKVLRARVYLAFGISGAVQHRMGTKDCQTVIAVNKNPQAEMMQEADLAVVGDVQEILPAFLAQLKDRGKKGAQKQ